MKNIAGLLLAILLTGSVSAGDATKGKDLSAPCAACHGATGISPLTNQPSLAGQGEKYFIKQMQEFKSGVRANAIMAPMVAELSDEDIADLAAFYASQQMQYAAVKQEYIELGEKLYLFGDSDRDIPACIACHAADGNGMPAAGFPAIAGQHADYTKLQLQAFRNAQRANDENKVMRDVVAKMSDQQIEAIAHYLTGLHAAGSEQATEE